jgi:hypothetical protein
MMLQGRMDRRILFLFDDVSLCARQKGTRLVASI